MTTPPPPPPPQRHRHTSTADNREEEEENGDEKVLLSPFIPILSLYHNDYFFSGSAYRAGESRYGVTATPRGRR